MKTRMILTGIAAAVMLAAPLATQAADLARPRYEAPPDYVVAPFSWTGFYAGLNGGYMWGKSNWSGGAGTFEISPDGFIGGGTLGYNFQAGAWVLGLEGDVDYVDAKGTANAAFCANCTFENTWLGTLRGRVGYSFGQWLPYLTGGGAWGNAKVQSAGGSVSDTKGGWTAGGGVEYSFAGPWSAKVEYLYVDLGTATCNAAACVLLTDAQVDFTANIVRAGVNYRF
jgi:outer membrane immunogenic protein